MGSYPFKFALVKAESVDRGFETIQPDAEFQVIEPRHRIDSNDGPLSVGVGVIDEDESTGDVDSVSSRVILNILCFAGPLFATDRLSAADRTRA